jgi:hypothetical protein
MAIVTFKSCTDETFYPLNTDHEPDCEYAWIIYAVYIIPGRLGSPKVRRKRLKKKAEKKRVRTTTYAKRWHE